MDCLGSGGEATVVVSFLEAWKHLFAQNPAAYYVGEYTFEPIAGADGRAAQILGYKYEQAIVLVGLPEAPFLEKIGGELIDITAFDVVDHHHHGFCRAGAANVAHGGVDTGYCGIREYAVGIAHKARAVVEMHVRHISYRICPCGSAHRGYRYKEKDIQYFFHLIIVISLFSAGPVC